MKGAPGWREWQTYTSFERSVITKVLSSFIDKHNDALGD